ncbi:MAG: tRNA lysidine(34) synthetase TilS [Bacteroidales bacterium]|jgi:tRNA(Ile)-lysidine synthase|nr:tRNA lysidine(34) synthetase TilS [Bacteroidales bacterium]MCI1785149.1 tRNA lysidine(34) synthetase TilS [Bacteroidales bacterium]
MQTEFDKELIKLFVPGKPVLLAVSGGIDSMCMAELFLNSSVKVSFALAHCNFHLRGSESDSDEKLVADWSSRNGIGFNKIDFDTRKYAADHSVSIEMAARDLRYGWFASLCAKGGFQSVAVAHNANDNAETLILNLLRGTGGRGLCGMSPSSLLPFSDDGKTRLIRPLLMFPRSDIANYVSSRGIDYHNDRTNAQTEFKRNKIRHLVFPLFEQLNPSYLKTLNREMKYFTQENEIADDYFRKVRASLILGTDSVNNGVEIDIYALARLPHRDYVLFRLLEPYGFSGNVLDSLERMLASGRFPGGKIYKSSDYKAVISSGRLIVRHIPVSFGPVIDEAENCMVIEGPGTYEFNGHKFSIEIMPWRSDMPLMQPDGKIIFDASSLPFPFVARKWLAGDWYKPFGFGKKKKLSDWFPSCGFSLFDKSSSVVLVKPGQNGKSDITADHISAVLGYRSGKPVFRIDDSLKVSHLASEVIMISDSDIG